MTTVWIATFWIAAGMLAYVLVGYPLLLLALSGMVRRRSPEPFEPHVTLIIPAHNEEKTLRAKLRNALEIEYDRERLDITVASDGSVDATVEIAREFEPQGVAVLDFPNRRGKASVLNDAAAAATGEVLCLCDANVIFQPDALKILVARLGDPAVGAATGDVRLASHESNFGQGESFYYALERQLQTAESEVGSLMGVDGGMYVVRKPLFRPLPPDTILDDHVVSMEVIRQGQRVVYEPRAIADENGTPAARQEWRRRVRVAAGATQSIKRGIWPPRSRPVELWQFLSHKALRWLAPLWLAVLLAANAALLGAGLFYQLTMAAQAAVYLAAVLATLSVRFRNSRIGGIPFYFVMSNAAMAVGLIKGLFDLQPVTWAQAERTGTDQPQDAGRQQSEPEALDTGQPATAVAEASGDINRESQP